MTEQLDLIAMNPGRTAVLVLAATLTAFARDRTLPGVGAAMQEMMAKNEIAGAVTVVVAKDRLAAPRSDRLGRRRGEAADDAGHAVLDRLDDQAGDRRRGR